MDFLERFKKHGDDIQIKVKQAIRHLERLERIIEKQRQQKLSEAIHENEDQELKPLLATLEYKARRCKRCIEDRLAVRN